jgi:hypothetical protein
LEFFQVWEEHAIRRRESIASIGSVERIWTVESFYVQGATREHTEEEEIVSRQISLRQPIAI